MGNNQTKKLTYGAIIAALFGVLSLLNTYTGSMFDIFICYGMVIPLVWYGYQYSFKDNIIVCIVSMIVIAMVGIPYFVISAFASCLSGLFIAEALKRKASKKMILFGVFCVSMLNNILLYEVFAGLIGMDMVGEITEMYQMMQTVFPQVSLNISLDLMISLIPLILILTACVETYVILLICQITLMRFKIYFPGNFHIATFRLNIKEGISVILAMFVTFILDTYNIVNVSWLRYIYILCYMILVLNGLAVVCYYLIIKRKNGFMLVAFLLLFIPYIVMGYSVIGIFDIFSDLREKLLYNRHN